MLALPPFRGTSRTVTGGIHERKVAPLKPAEDARMLDSSGLSIEDRCANGARLDAAKPNSTKNSPRKIFMVGSDRMFGLFLL